jgi:hypothetical protein
MASAFTPDSLNERAPLADDRPYASLTGIGVRVLSVDAANHRSAWTSELVVGMIGLNLARNAQTYIHRRLQNLPSKPEPYDPLGWHNQISNGGEPTALYRLSYDRFVLGDPPTPGSHKNFQVSAGASGSLGYYTTASANVGARLGWFVSEFWENAPSMSGNMNQSLGRNAHRGRRAELFAFVNVRPRLTLYNALLQGQFRRSAVRVRSVEVERLQYEHEVGVTGYVPLGCFGVQAAWVPLVLRTRDALNVQYSTHRWGTATIGMSFALPASPAGHSSALSRPSAY